jgi:hypothetical protein
MPLAYRPAARRLAACVASLALTAVTAMPAPAQSPSPAAAPAATSPALPIKIVLSAQTLAGLPRRQVTVNEEHGGTATYAGVDLGDVLAAAGVPRGKALRGRYLAAYAIVIATDGYRAVFALPELDPAFTDRIVLLADQRNGAPLPADLGPFRIVIPDEKRAARWIHSAVEIDVEPVPSGAGSQPAPANGGMHGT